MNRTISIMVGKGSVNHNSRKFHAKNTDPERSYLNVEYCNANLQLVYHQLFRRNFFPGDKERFFSFIIYKILVASVKLIFFLWRQV